jgi:hypothetical protein
LTSKGGTYEIRTFIMDPHSFRILKGWRKGPGWKIQVQRNANPEETKHNSDLASSPNLILRFPLCFNCEEWLKMRGIGYNLPF